MLTVPKKVRKVAEIYLESSTMHLYTKSLRLLPRSFQMHTVGCSMRSSTCHILHLTSRLTIVDIHTTGSPNRTRQITRMGNKSGSGPFTPVVIVARNVLGKKDFNQFRGKAISLHSQGMSNGAILGIMYQLIMSPSCSASMADPGHMGK